MPREYRALRSDGSTFPFEISSMPIAWQGEAAVLGIGRDLTERRRSEAELIQADRMASVGLLAAGVAHEINNPLTYTLLHLSKLRRMLPDLVPAGDARSEVDRLLLQAIEGGDRVAGIVRDLLAFVRGNDGGANTRDVVGVLESALKLAHTAIDSRAVVVRKIEPTPPVGVDEARLGQVFVTLLANALQAMQGMPEDQRKLEVRVGVDDGRVRVEICDRGPGIDPAVAERIFDPFFTTKDVGEGTGLGLAITRSIVTAAGGSIGASARSGGGTIFSLWLPIAESCPRRARPPSPVPVFRGRVLVVDDDEQVAEAIADLLSERYDVECMSDCGEALERIFSGQTFDVIVCDLSMPRIDGVDAFQRIVERKPELIDRILFMTGGARTEKQRKFSAEHSERLLSKPLDVDDVFERIDRLVNAGRASES